MFRHLGELRSALIALSDTLEFGRESLRVARAADASVARAYSYTCGLEIGEERPRASASAGCDACGDTLLRAAQLSLHAHVDSETIRSGLVRIHRNGGTREGANGIGSTFVPAGPPSASPAGGSVVCSSFNFAQNSCRPDLAIGDFLPRYSNYDLPPGPRPPVFLACGHACCVECLPRLASDAEEDGHAAVHCATCRRRTEVPRGGMGRLPLDYGVMDRVRRRMQASSTQASQEEEAEGMTSASSAEESDRRRGWEAALAVWKASEVEVGKDGRPRVDVVGRGGEWLVRGYRMRWRGGGTTPASLTDRMLPVEVDGVEEAVRAAGIVQGQETGGWDWSG